MRNMGLDLLRLIAVLLIIGRHLDLINFPIPEVSKTFVQIWHRSGWVGVDLFFVLSGFLVSSLLFREYLTKGRVNIKRFLIRRGFKIYPAFVFFLFISILAKVSIGEPRSMNHVLLDPSNVLAEMFFLQNYIRGVWGHTWSLAVEEHFYLGLAAITVCLVACFPNRPFAKIPLIFLVVAMTCLCLRLINPWNHPEFSTRYYVFPTHLRIDSLLFGVFLSYLWNFSDLEKRLKPIPWVAMILFAILLLLPAFVFEIQTTPWISTYGFTLFYLGSGLLLLTFMRIQTSKSRVLRVMASFGAASYSIYLWHIAVATWGFYVVKQTVGFEHFYLYLFNAVVGACCFGWLMNRWIETPSLFLRDRMFPSASTAISIPVAEAKS